MLIEETLRNGYKGLFGEVVTEDTYRLRQLEFIPSCIVDIGANIGILSRFARELFPNALIVAVEPHKENCDVFRYFTNDKNIILIEKAIGSGSVWHGLTAANGSGETYLNAGIGFPTEGMKVDDRMELSTVKTITLTEIVDTYIKPDEKFVIKIDCEGNEHTILFNEQEMASLRKAEYLCMEIHRYALTSVEWQEVQDKTLEALNSLSDQFDIELDGVHFWAKKKHKI